MLAARSEKRRAVNGIERVRKVDRDKHLARVRSMSSRKLVDDVEKRFSTHLHGNSCLKWPQVSLGVFLDAVAEATRRHSSEDFANRNGSNVSVSFW